MKLKLTKFHGVVHMADDILNFGVPLEVDTGTNKSRHKPTKTAARLTQKIEETLDLQTAIHLEELHLLDLAMLEFEGKPIYNYGKHRTQHCLKQPPPPNNVPIGGATFVISTDNLQQYVVTMTTKSKDDGTAKLETGLITFVAELQRVVKDYISSIPLCTIHKHQGQIF
jgi:hypothetical protein